MEVPVPNPNQVNGAITYYCHAGSVSDTRLRTTVRLLADMMHDVDCTASKCNTPKTCIIRLSRRQQIIFLQAVAASRPMQLLVLARYGLLLRASLLRAIVPTSCNRLEAYQRSTLAAMSSATTTSSIRWRLVRNATTCDAESCRI